MVDLHAFHATLNRLGASGAVWIAAINGAAMGGGCELSLACDLRLISAGGILGQPEILLGFPPGGGGTQRLSRLIGRARALEIILEGRPVEAEEALEIGMVHRVVEPDELLAVAVETAERLARRSKAAVGGVKRAVLEGGSMSLEAGLRRGAVGVPGDPRERPGTPGDDRLRRAHRANGRATRLRRGRARAVDGRHLRGHERIVPDAICGLFPSLRLDTIATECSASRFIQLATGEGNQ